MPTVLQATRTPSLLTHLKLGGFGKSKKDAAQATTDGKDAATSNGTSNGAGNGGVQLRPRQSSASSDASSDVAPSPARAVTRVPRSEASSVESVAPREDTSTAAFGSPQSLRVTTTAAPSTTTNNSTKKMSPTKSLKDLAKRVLTSPKSGKEQDKSPTKATATPPTPPTIVMTRQRSAASDSDDSSDDEKKSKRSSPAKAKSPANAGASTDASAGRKTSTTEDASDKKSKKEQETKKATEEKAAKAQAAKDKAAQDKAEKEKAAEEKAAAAKAAKENAAEEKAAKARAAKDKAADEKAAKEKAAHDKAIEAKVAKEKAAEEKAVKVQVAKDKKAADKTAKEQFAKDKAAAEKAAKEQAAADKAAKEQTVKDQATKDKTVVSPPAKDEPSKPNEAKRGTESDANSSSDAVSTPIGAVTSPGAGANSTTLKKAASSPKRKISIKAAFGVVRRSSVMTPRSERHLQNQQSGAFVSPSAATERTTSSAKAETPQLSSSSSSITVDQQPDAALERTSTNGGDAQVNVDHVARVRDALDDAITQMDAVDPKKLRAVRLGGELRGLLGKAQDEFLAYEDSFEEFAHEIGVSIALQNLAASLSQVFPIIARLRTAKFMLNKKFKADVLFAFQEFNSYYTSLFMELSMSVARRSGIVLPLPSPVRPAPVEEPAPAPPELPAPAPVEELPPLPVPEEPAEVKAERLCLQAHGHYFGYRQAENPEQAFQLYQQAAVLGCCEAMNCIGRMYLNGKGVAQDVLQAEEWLNRSAGHGCIDSCYLLGTLLKDKATYHKAPQKQRELHALALVRFTQAAENGHKDAQFHVGKYYEEGVIGQKDVVQACAWYKRAAEQNHIGAATALGRLLCVGSADAVEKDVVQAIHYLQRAAAEADVLALRQLGLVYAAGDDVKKDVDRATLCLRKAAAGGDHEAMYHLGVLLLSNDPDATAMQLEDSEDRFDEAVRWLLNAAAAGIVDANYVLGQTFENSKYLRDKSAALRYYTKAARARPVHAKAARRAAVMHYSGIACQVDRWKAHSLYTLAADAGDADSLNALGLMYEEGEGCDLDYRQAAACYRKAIELHNPHAHFNLGCLLSQGKGVARNSDAAQSHFQKAVELGFALAKDFLVENR